MANPAWAEWGWTRIYLVPPEQKYIRDPENVPNLGLVVRLKNWVNERPIWLIGQRKVRKDVANAITTDVLHPVSSPSENPARLVKYRRQVNDALAYSFGKLKKLPKDDNGLIIQSPEQKDSVSKESFHTEIIRESDAWVSREMGTHGVISEAKLYDDGNTVITLNYQGERIESQNANPSLIFSADYPTGAKVLFLKHTASLGVIGWGRKTKKEIDRLAGVRT